MNTYGGDTGLSHWASDRQRDAYWRAYDQSLGLWPIPITTSFVDTPHGRTHLVTSGNRAGAPLVLMHAASLSATQWYPQAAELGREHHLIAVDIMGDIGRSTQAAPMRTRADAAAWLVAVLDALGIRSAVFIGSSFGGFLSANLATFAPARVRSLVLLAPAATLQPFSTMSRLFIRMGSLWPLPSTVRPGLRSMMGGALPDERIVRQMELGVAGFRYDRGGIFPSALDDEDLGRISCPTLVLLGENERIYDAGKAAARASALIRGSEVEVFPGVGHLPGLQEPSLTNRRIRAFLAANDA